MAQIKKTPSNKKKSSAQRKSRRTTKTDTEKSASKPSAAPQPAEETFIAFPTVYHHRKHQGTEIEEMNTELRRYAFQIEKKQKSDKTSSIIGGHHSDRKLFEHNNWAVQKLKNLIMGDFARYLEKFWSQECTQPLNTMGLEQIQLYVSGWTMIMRSGDMSAPHLHPHANISGTYYVAVPANCQNREDQRGFLVICDPRIRAGVAPIRTQTTSIKIPPEEGGIIMFPSYIEHYVLPFKGKGERISIAFNIHLPRELGGVAKKGVIEENQY